MYDFLLVTSNNCMPTPSTWDIAIQNMQELEFDLTRSLKVKSDGAIKKSTYDFLSENISQYMPICSNLRDIPIQN